MSTHSARRFALPVMMAAYVLSQFYRSYVAVIATQLIDDFLFSPQWFGFFAGAFYFTFAVAQFPLGLAFDRFGVRKPLLVCVALGSIGAVVLPLTHSVPWAIASQVALGIGCAPLYMGLLNYVLKSGNGPKQVRIVTTASAVGYLGAIFAGLPLAWGVALLGWRASLGVIGVLMVLASAAIALTFHEDSASMADGDAAGSSTAVAPRENMKSRIAFAALIPVCFAVISGGTFRMSWGGPYLTDLFHFDVVERGYAMTAASVLALCWALSIPRVLRYMEVKTLVLCAFAVGVFSALVLALWPAQQAMLGVALVCVLFCVGSVHPLVMSQARSVVPARSLGTWLGVLNSMVFLGVAVCNSSFGWIAENAVLTGLSQEQLYGRLFLLTGGILSGGFVFATLSPRIAREPVQDKGRGRSVTASGT